MHWSESSDTSPWKNYVITFRPNSKHALSKGELPASPRREMSHGWEKDQSLVWANLFLPWNQTHLLLLPDPPHSVTLPPGGKRVLKNRLGMSRTFFPFGTHRVLVSQRAGAPRRSHWMQETYSYSTHDSSEACRRPGSCAQHPSLHSSMAHPLTSLTHPTFKLPLTNCSLYSVNPIYTIYTQRLAFGALKQACPFAVTIKKKKKKKLNIATGFQMRCLKINP